MSFCFLIRNLYFCVFYILAITTRKPMKMNKKILIAWLFILALKVQGTPTDTTKEIDSLLVLSHNGIVTVDTDATLKYAMEALSLSDSINFSSGKSRAYFYIGQTLFNIASYKKALEYLTLAEKEKYAAVTPKILFEICRVRGQIYAYLELNSQSIREFHKCFQHLRNLKIEEHQHFCASLTYENLGVVYEKLKQTDSVLYYLKLNRKLLESMDESFVYFNKVNMYGSWANYHIEQSKYDSVEYYLKRALSLSSKYDYPYTSRTYMYWGDMEKKKGNTDASLHWYFKALDNLEHINLKGEYPLLYDRVSKIYEQKGVPDSARLYKEKQILIENELSKEKASVAEEAFKILLEDEKNSWMEALYPKVAIVVAGLFVAIALISVYHKRIYRKLATNTSKETTELKQKLNESFNEVIELAKSNDSTFLKRFSEVYPDYLQRLLQKHPDLSISEQRFCAMLFFDFSSKEIAAYTFVEHRSVQTKKNRLRKKLNIPVDMCLYQYVKSFV